MSDMITVEEALARVLASAEAPLGEERVALEEAHGRVLARDLVALRTQPPFPNSAMDGYALRAADTATRPRRLRWSASPRRAAPSTARVGPGEAVRIFTGAPMPDGADAIVDAGGRPARGRAHRARRARRRPATTCVRAGWTFAKARRCFRPGGG